MQTEHTMLEETLRLERGYQMGAYSLLERIGYGGEGAVWSGWDQRRRRVVAIKIMAAPEDQAIDGAQLSREFERQVHMLAGLEHPNILPLYEFGMTDEHYYFVMRYSCVGSLANLLLGGPLPLKEVLFLTAQIVSALSYLHQRSIVHRDIKPSNILLDSQRRVYLSDFGLAKRLVQETAPLHTGRGTSAYAPHEQYIPSLLTPQSDIYSLGIVIYEMLTGTLPWSKTEDLASAHFSADRLLPDLHQKKPELPAALTAVLRQMTAFVWADRPASAEKAFELIAQALSPNMQPYLSRLAGPRSPLDESHLLAQDAQYLVSLFIPGWRAESEAFPASLTNLAFIDSAYRQDESVELGLNDHLRHFMLRGALTYGYRLDYWWSQAAGLEMQARACEQTILLEEEEAVGRALMQLTRESGQDLPTESFSTDTLERLVDLALEPRGWALRNNALKTLRAAVSRGNEWRPDVISPEADAKLATLALSGRSQASQAAPLIGLIRSKTAVQALLSAHEAAHEAVQKVAHEETDSARFMEILKEIQAVAGLPAIVPRRLRFRIFVSRLREQLIEDREGVLSWSRALIGLAVATFFSLMMFLGLFSRTAAQMRDVLLEPYLVSGVVTIVEVNDSSLERYGRWDSWPRTLHAELIDRLNAAGAKAIVFDFLFDAETPQDELLAAAMARAGNVVQPVLGQGDAYHDPTSILRYQRVIRPQPDLLASSAAVGHTNILHDEDGYVRRLPTIVTFENEEHLSLALAALQVYLAAPGEGAPLPHPAGGYLDILGRHIPVGPFGEMIIYYAGPPARWLVGQPRATTFRTVAYQDVLDQTVNPEAFRDKIVLVGMTATAEPDRYLTPVSQGRPMYGVEILANVTESIWSRRFITRPSPVIQALILLFLGVVTGLLCARPWSGLFLAAVLTALYFLFAIWIFEASGLMLDLLFPFTTIAFSYVTVTAYRYSIEVRRRRQIMQLFQSRVTPEVAQATIEAVKKGEISLGGRVQELSVLIADIRGYRRYAEQYAPADLVEAINNLRDMLVSVVFAYEGTVTQFEGDKAMAIFNAPLPQPDHPRRVVQAAIAIKAHLQAYHASLPLDHPHRLLDFGYGLFTGRAIVGHTGSAQRYTYTAMGNAVAVASHLAQIAQPAQIILGQPPYEQVKDLVAARAIPPVHLKEEPAPIPAFSILGPA